MGQLEQLIESDTPLSGSDARALGDWLTALRSDMATFGPAPADIARIRQIERRLGLRTPATPDRSPEDRAGEALRRFRHGEIRPLWADMPDGIQKDQWRRAGASLIEFLDRCGLEVKVKPE